MIKCQLLSRCQLTRLEVKEIRDFSAVFSPEEYLKAVEKVSEKAADYLRSASLGEIPVLDYEAPEEKLARWQEPIPNKGIGTARAIELLSEAMDQSNHFLHPRYIGHQVPPVLPFAALCDHAVSLLNNSAAIYEMAPMEPVVETILLDWISKLLGLPQGSGGVFTNGGSIGNLTALLAARQAKIPGNIWQDGYDGGGNPCAVLVSEQSHYCVKRAVQIMGMGEGAAVSVDTDEKYRMDLRDLERSYKKAESEGQQVIAVSASACTTATGAYDPLEAIADFCEERDLWFHIDGAHGVAAALSPNHRHLLAGAERADSIVWDLHKMMLMPSLLTAVVFKRFRDNYLAFAQEASYLFNSGSEEPWFDLANRTLECTKQMNAVKAFLSLHAYGSDFFGDYVDRCFELTNRFAEFLDKSGDFKLAAWPESNIVCFRYEPNGVAPSDLDRLQKAVREALLRSGRFYIVQTELRGKWFLRCTVINPLTSEDDLRQLMEEVRAVAAGILD